MCRQGLSRIELLLVLLFLALIAGLILPAIIRVREAANRTNCVNNLKQIVLACHNYNDAYRGQLPPLTDQGDNAPTGHGVESLFFRILPYVESDVLYYMYTKFGRTGYNSSSSSLVFSGSLKGYPIDQWGGSANQFYRVYVDPADLTADKLRDVPMTLPDGVTGYYATGSYAANGLVFWLERRSASADVRGWLLLHDHVHRATASVRDAAGETVYNLWGLGFYSPHMPAFATLTPDDPAGLLSTGQVGPVVPMPDGRLPDRDTQYQVRIGRQTAAAQPPDFTTPVQMLRGGQPCDPRLPGSPHAKVIQAAMADGSVRQFAATVSPWVFSGLAHRMATRTCGVIGKTTLLFAHSILHCSPQLTVLIANERVQLIRKCLRQRQRHNQFLNVSQVLEPTRFGHAGRELEFQQRRQTQTRDAFDLDPYCRRVRKRNRLRLAVARIISRDQKLDPHAGVGVA